MSIDNLRSAKNILERAKAYLGIKSDKELVEMLGIAQSTLSSWKKRESIDLDSIIALCEGADLNWLILGKGGDQISKLTDSVGAVEIGEVVSKLAPVRDADGEITHYLKSTVTAVSKEEGDAMFMDSLTR